MNIPFILKDIMPQMLTFDHENTLRTKNEHKRRKHERSY